MKCYCTYTFGAARWLPPLAGATYNMIKIYNSLTRKKEKFKPIKKDKVGMYVCGPTVYDEPHIGHARSAYVFDVIRNYLLYRRYKVKFVKNITDVDDKIIEKARQELEREKSGSLRLITKAVATKYLKRYYEDMDSLGIKRADVEPRATSYIRKMQDVIKKLIDKGLAYVSDGDVYFDVYKFKNYGRLSGQSLDKMELGARVHREENKKNPLDFALWKSAKPQEPSWESPWGYGRPGWHIECSTMSMYILGENFDIHGGGLDLIFPHHENEIAQSESFSNKRFANYWMHNGLLTINGEKMAKSLGNFISIKDILEKYHPEALKLFFLSGHYRSPIDFTYDKMEEAKRARERFYILFDKISRVGSYLHHDKTTAIGIKEIEALKERFQEAMDDDFNTPLALGYLYEIVNSTNKMIDNNRQDKKVLVYSKKVLLKLGKIFGLFIDKSEFRRRMTLESRIKAAIEQRDEARRIGDYDKADKIRKRLFDEGIILEDTKEGTVWRRRL